MKALGIIMVFFASIAIILSITFGILCYYNYSRDIGSYWNLADKASTIPQKSKQIDIFVTRLQESNLAGGYNAIILQTPDNSFDQNFIALQSFQGRLHEIQGMDIKSFEYQTAIQQITAQEQGEAKSMLDEFFGVYIKTHYFLLWNWVCYVQVILCIIIGVWGAASLVEGRGG